MAEAQFDISRVQGGPEGLEGFFWPVSRPDILAVRDAFLLDAIPFLKQEGIRDRRAMILGLLIHILSELLVVYQAQALIRRSRDAGREPQFSPHARFSNALAAGQLLHEARVVSQLRAGVAQVPLWRRSAAVIRDRLRGGMIRRQLPSMVNFRREIVTVAGGDMILQHAAVVGPVYHVGFGEWFSPLQAEDRGGFSGQLHDDLLDSMLGYLRQAFAAGGEVMTELLEQHFRWWMREASDLADRYLTRLLRKPESLPKTLWRGTGGHLWSRILSCAVRENGGHVTGHDHSHGQGAWSSASDTIIEHPFSDRFMVWSETQKAMAARNMESSLHLPGDPPKIDIVPGDFRPRISPTWQGKVRKLLTPTVMYVGTLYVDDFMPYSPLLPAPALLDWELRLLADLKASGCDILVKPHPENRQDASKQLFQNLGATVIGGRFEDVWNQADILLFSQPNSSSFFSALSTDVPIILPRLELNPWQSEAMALLQRRCALMPCHTSSENRIITTPDAIQRAINLAPELKDGGFYRTFMSKQKLDQ